MTLYSIVAKYIRSLCILKLISVYKGDLNGDLKYTESIKKQGVNIPVVTAKVQNPLLSCIKEEQCSSCMICFHKVDVEF